MSAHGLIAPTHRAIRRYYENVAAFQNQRVFNEMNVRSAFEFLLADTGKLKGWTLIPELSEKSGGALIRPDGTLRDRNSLPRGYWEAKDTQDDLDTEIKKKIGRGYPLSNIIFEDTQSGVLFQNKQKINGPYNLVVGSYGLKDSLARHAIRRYYGQDESSAPHPLSRKQTAACSSHPRILSSASREIN